MFELEVTSRLSVRQLIESRNGDMKRVVRELADGLAKKDDDPNKMKFEDFSIKEMYFACAQSTLESVDVTQFPVLTATLVERKIIEAYREAALIGDQLVTPFPSNLQTSVIPGAFVQGNLRDIQPGMPYEHDGDVAEKFVQITGVKRGSILDVTWEAVKFDQTGLILMTAGRFGQRAAIDREQRIIWTILDVTIGNINYWAWFPSVAGVATRTAIWSLAVAGGPHPQSNLIANALQDWTDLDAAKTLLALMQDDNGDAILNVPKILLVPASLDTIAQRLISNQIVPSNWNNTTLGSGGENNPFHNKFQVLSSALLDGQSTREWFLGDFKRQFVEKVVFPLEVLTRPMSNTDDEFERDIVAQYKVRHWTQVGALDYRFCVKSLGTYGICPSDSYCTTWVD
jgi:hypothetical protein